MKKIYFLLVILCVFCLTGCKGASSRISSINQEQEITEIENVQYEDDNIPESEINELENI